MSTENITACNKVVCFQVEDEEMRIDQPSEPSVNSEQLDPSKPELSSQILKSPEHHSPLTKSTATDGSASHGDDQFFKAIPVAVRQPLRLPKHATHILDSRITQGQSAEEGRIYT